MKEVIKIVLINIAHDRYKMAQIYETVKEICQEDKELCSLIRRLANLILSATQ